MLSMIIKQFGDFNVFEEALIDKPSLKEGHVLIKVEATSVNPLDIKLRSGGKPGLIPSFPMVLHGDVAGTVVEVDKAVSRFKVGDEVYGCAGGFLDMQGALAEYMQADADLLAHKPKSLSFLQAAALPLVSLTAWDGLITRARIQKNQHILIHGATGGVGHLAIQLANHLGAIVSATASTLEKCEIAKQLGAKHAINYKTTSVEDYTLELTQSAGFDIVFDTVGGNHLQNSIKATAINGQIITILSADFLDTTPAFSKGLSIHFILQPLPLITGINRKYYGKILEDISTLADSGIIKPLLDPHKLTIRDVAAAHELVETNQAIGKVVMSNTWGRSGTHGH